MRTASQQRVTKETQIDMSIKLEGSGNIQIDTGIGFFDHLLTLFAFQAKVDLIVKVKGDLYVCDHHTIEDTGIVLGQLLQVALGDRVGITRYGSARVAMDEALSTVDLDLCNRAYLVFNCPLNRETINTYSTEMTKEFLRAFAFQSGMTLHVNTVYGENDHHKIESIFKALGRALKQAIYIESDTINSTKGVL